MAATFPTSYTCGFLANRFRFFAWVAVWLGCGLGTQTDAAEPPVEFNRDIRPILSDRCYTCHGPDEKKRDSELRLDSPEAAMADLAGHRAIVPGDLAASTLWRS